MNQPKVSVLIAAWNRRDEVLQTIQSVYEQDYSNFEIILVDNGSSDGTCDAVKDTYPKVRLVPLKENLGATGGRNAGIRVVSGEIVLCLDSDASLEHSTVKNIVKKFEVYPDLGVVNSKVINAFTREFDNIAGWAYSAKQRAKSEQEFFTHNFSETGCAIRKEALAEAGLFWDRLFFGREGEELALRILDAGWRILYCPSAVVLHRVSPNKRISSTERQFLDFRNSLYIYLVRYPFWLLVLLLPIKIFAELIKGIRQGNIHWVMRALWKAVQNFPSLMKERRPIRKETAQAYLNFQREQGVLSWNLKSWLKSKT